MSGVTSKIPKEFKTLSSKDRISYVQDLWDFIAETPDQVPIPEPHKQVLDQRLATYKADPNVGKPWRQVRDNILKNLQNT
jgi:putative addiction module component (TIGR02574 family)